MENQSKLRFYGLENRELELPSPEDLTPLSQTLISPELALAFGITPDTSSPQIDLNRVSYDNCSTKFPSEENLESSSLKLFPGGSDLDSPNNNKTKRGGDYFMPDEANSGLKDENGDDNGPNRAGKKQRRLVWTPTLHKRFIDVIEHLGIDKAVPKTIMELMNVDGLTRENVASHLQKYRLYLKRIDGVSNDDHSTTTSRRDQSLFECDGFRCMTLQPPQPPPPPPPPPQQPLPLHCNSLPLMPMPLPMPMIGPPPSAYGIGHLGLPVATSAPPGYCGLESGAYNFFWNRQRG